MIDLFLILIISSVVGTAIWIMQNSIKPITQKVFSQTWHYRISLIPLFFLLGGTVLVNSMIQFVYSLLSNQGTVAEGNGHVLLTERTASNLFMNQLFTNWLQQEYMKQIVLFVMLIWAVGTISFLTINVKKYLAFKRFILHKSRVCTSVPCPVKVIISSNATTPMLLGLWKPIVVLPDTQFAEKELAMILSHELVHLKSGDLFVKLVVLVANAIHWFNPAVYSLNKQMNILCELSCDEKVVQTMDNESRRLYGEMLLSMLDYGMQRSIVGTSNFSNSKKYMKRRLLNVMTVKKTRKSTMLLSLVVTIAIVGSGGLVANAVGAAVPFHLLSGGGKGKESSDEEIIERIKLYEVKALPMPRAYHNTATVTESYNIYVQHPDGTVEYFDKAGNRKLVPHKKKSMYRPVDEDTQKKVNELNAKIDSYIQKGLPAPQKYLDELNELYRISPFGDE